MNRLSHDALAEFQQIVQHNDQFVTYFKQATPEQELGNLKIGSRPARAQKAGTGIQYLRAIPWIFCMDPDKLNAPRLAGGSVMR